MDRLPALCRRLMQEAPKRIVLSGPSGFLGSRVLDSIMKVHALRASAGVDPGEVILLSSSPGNLMARLSLKYGDQNLRTVRASRVDYYEQHDVGAWVDQLRSLGVQGKNSTFLNLAGVAGPIKGRKEAMHAVNYKAPVAAAAACQLLGVGHFIQSSTSATNAERSGQVPYSRGNAMADANLSYIKDMPVTIASVGLLYCKADITVGQGKGGNKLNMIDLSVLPLTPIMGSGRAPIQPIEVTDAALRLAFLALSEPSERPRQLVQSSLWLQRLQLEGQQEKVMDMSKSVGPFMKLVWLQEPENGLRRLLKQGQLVPLFLEFLSRDYAEATLQVWLEAQELCKLPSSQQEAAARVCHQKFYGDTIDISETGAMSTIQKKADDAIAELAGDHFPRFLQDEKLSTKLVNSLLWQSSKSLNDRGGQVDYWKDYKLEQDVAHWFKMFMAVAETFPYCLVLSDITIPGNPMFYVNQEFTRVTGYSKAECQGRNCRFLQGPETEPDSIAVICETLRKAEDCHVVVTNYRKDGGKFKNLLTLRPVHDSNGRYRFVIGVQYEVSGSDKRLDDKLQSLGTILRTLPTVIDVAEEGETDRSNTQQRGSVFSDTMIEAKQADDMLVRLESALAKGALNGDKEGDDYSNKAQPRERKPKVSHTADELREFADEIIDGGSGKAANLSRASRAELYRDHSQSKLRIYDAIGPETISIGDLLAAFARYQGNTSFVPVHIDYRNMESLLNIKSLGNVNRQFVSLLRSEQDGLKEPVIGDCTAWDSLLGPEPEARMLTMDRAFPDPKPKKRYFPFLKLVRHVWQNPRVIWPGLLLGIEVTKNAYSQGAIRKMLGGLGQAAAGGMTNEAQAEAFIKKFVKREGQEQGQEGAGEVTEEAVQELLLEFQNFDKGCKGELLEHEAMLLIESRSSYGNHSNSRMQTQDQSFQELRSMLDAIDVDHNGRVSFIEWACVIFDKEWDEGEVEEGLGSCSVAADATTGKAQMAPLARKAAIQRLKSQLREIGAV